MAIHRAAFGRVPRRICCLHRRGNGVGSMMCPVPSSQIECSPFAAKGVPFVPCGVPRGSAFGAEKPNEINWSPMSPMSPMRFRVALDSMPLAGSTVQHGQGTTGKHGHRVENAPSHRTHGTLVRFQWLAWRSHGTRRVAHGTLQDGLEPIIGSSLGVPKAAVTDPEKALCAEKFGS